MERNQNAFLLAGSFFSIIAALWIFTGIAAGELPPASSYTALSLAILSFCMIYLYPHLKNDQIKWIRKRAFRYTLVALFVCVAGFLITLPIDKFTLGSVDFLTIVISILISTQFLSMVWAAKRI
ncbi:hypothetical protein Q7A53_08320 [Halobacillus rhizosphaerae]|uniref:hypothetical protein n=1 Tax=Halobacillus rhizosphaerae TaxID=3064889 RepID=UPI00398AD6B9